MVANATVSKVAGGTRPAFSERISRLCSSTSGLQDRWQRDRQRLGEARSTEAGTRLSRATLARRVGSAGHEKAVQGGALLGID